MPSRRFSLRRDEIFSVQTEVELKMNGPKGSKNLGRKPLRPNKPICISVHKFSIANPALADVL